MPDPGPDAPFPRFRLRIRAGSRTGDGLNRSCNKKMVTNSREMPGALPAGITGVRENVPGGPDRKKKPPAKDGFNARINQKQTTRRFR